MTLVSAPDELVEPEADRPVRLALRHWWANRAEP